MVEIIDWCSIGSKVRYSWLTALALVAVGFFVTACSEHDDHPSVEVIAPDETDDSSGSDTADEDSPGDDGGEEPGDEADGLTDQGDDTGADSQEKPYITAEVTYPLYPQLRNLNFVYPSKDPQGKPVMLSGTITMGHTMSAEKRAQGFLLYNHYTVCRADECPSEGMLDMQNILYLTAPYRNFITVSADYYGFGATADKTQAYCLASANARASVDALLAARQLLAERGYTWSDDLLNVGYSQGGQTAIGVLRLATEEYPELRFTRTMAGGGPYDLEETYRQYLAEGSVKLPSAVVSILMAYNEYYQLGIPNDQMFRGPTLQHLADWWLSKQLTSTEIDRKMGSGDITQFIAPQLLDLDSDVSRRVMEALSRESLCRGWSPRKEERIFLLHHNADDISPSVNTLLLYEFLQGQGVEQVELQVADFLTLGISQHISGAAAFLTIVGQWIRDNYMIQ